MISIYNLVQALILVFAWPVLLALILLTTKYRTTILSRLGIGLKSRFPVAQTPRKTVWIHALSVGEVSSARPLITGIKKEFPHVLIVVSVTTATGRQVASTLVSSEVDEVIFSPLDLRPVIALFIRRIQPDLFILVETDFWPNILDMLAQKNIPTILVNGRISERSYARYRKAACIFQSLFQSFRHLCMQTETDRLNMERLGVDPAKLHCPGNLKFDTCLTDTGFSTGNPFNSIVPDDSLVLLAGSTHEGEENSIFSVYVELKKKYANLFLIIAPRNPSRCPEIVELAGRFGLSPVVKSATTTKTGDILLIDSLGELPRLYAFADIAFVGGSLVEEGGHNPVEPAAHGVPVLFGRHMEDFAEISRDLVNAGGAQEVADTQSFASALDSLLASEEHRKAAGRRAFAFVENHRGVVERHLAIIRAYL